ncbi:MAG: peptidoglycan DD-metalloendopeptidase family protein [Burkholderiaceae bacterium]|jgi:septal ring factor EnvC (AmiA/AmiB activator)|nr:peptidoglycan DD-metalloendopeptidase family protein [Burkholderiaceae bacterium]
MRFFYALALNGTGNASAGKVGCVLLLVTFFLGQVAAPFAAERATTARATTAKAPAAKGRAKGAAKRTARSPKTAGKQEKRTAEKEREKTRQRLSRLKQQIGKTETAKDKASSTLVKSEEAIQRTNRSIAELETKQTQSEATLKKLEVEQTRLETIVAQQQERLGRLLQEQYISGSEDSMKLLLSGDNPNRINRELRYMSYLSGAQVRLTESLRENVREVESRKMQVENTRQELEKIARKRQLQREKLEKEKAAHATLLTQLSSKLERQRKQAAQLEQDEKRLTALVDRLSLQAEEKRRAAEKKRTASKKQGGKGTTQTAESVPQPDSFSGAFAKKRGRLRLPVRGKIAAQYGAKRTDGPSWKGVFISTAPDAEVRCVADGVVIFANTMRSFGNMVIVDHGSQYMTIYANAQTLRKKVGDPVKTGDIIANAGNNSDNTLTGLYFEMRYKGRAFNPMDWVASR